MDTEIYDYPWLGVPIEDYTDEETKWCKSCGKLKRINQIRDYMDDFTKRSSGSRDGYRAQCKECYTAIRRENTYQGHINARDSMRSGGLGVSPDLMPENKVMLPTESTGLRNCSGWKHVKAYYEQIVREDKKLGRITQIPDVGCGGKPLMLSEFHRNKANPRGVGTICKWCSAELNIIRSLKYHTIGEESPSSPDDLHEPVFLHQLEETARVVTSVNREIKD